MTTAPGPDPACASPVLILNPCTNACSQTVVGVLDGQPDTQKQRASDFNVAVQRAKINFVAAIHPRFDAICGWR